MTSPAEFRGEGDREEETSTVDIPYKFTLVDDREFAACLDLLGVRARKNIRHDRHEVDLGAGWESFGRGVLARLQSAILRVAVEPAGKRTKPARLGVDGRLRDLLEAVAVDVDEFKVYLQALPPWDEVERLPYMLADQLGAPQDAAAVWGGVYMCLAPVERTFEPGAKLDSIPVLIGDQGIAKGYLIETIAGDGYGEFGGLDHKLAAEAAQGVVLMEWTESLGMSRREVGEIKAFLSRRDDGRGVRKAYRRDPQTMPRRYGIVATTNDDRPLPNDPSGNRRFVPVRCAGGEDPGDVRDWVAQHRDQLWAEGLARYRRGETAALFGELEQEMKVVQAEARSRDDVFEDAVAEAVAGRLPATSGEIRGRLPETLQRSTSGYKLAHALRALGLTATQKRWAPGERPARKWHR